MTHKNKFILLFSLITLLAAGYFLVNTFLLSDIPVKGPQRVEFSDIQSKDSINRITIETTSGEKTGFVRKNNHIFADVPRSISIDGQKLADFTNSFENLYAVRSIKKADKGLAYYGLKNPVATVTIELDDGTNRKIKVGKFNPSREARYILWQDVPDIFLLPSKFADQLVMTLNDIRNRNLPDVDQTQVYVYIHETPDYTIKIVPKDEWDETDQLGYHGSHKMIQPFLSPRIVISKFLENVVKDTHDARIIDFIEDNPASLLPYGLKNPPQKLFIQSAQGVFGLFIGKQVIGTVHYAMIPGKNSVFTFDVSQLQAFTIKPINYVDKLIAVVNRDELDLCVVEGKDTVLNLKVFHEQTEDKEKKKLGFALNNKALSEDEFMSYYKTILSITGETPYSSSVLPSTEPEHTITYYKYQEDTTYTIAFFPYDDYYYAAYKDGICDFLVSRSQVERIYDEADRILD